MTALLAGRPTVAAALLSLGASAAFFAHEPAVVLLGLRGARQGRELGALARRMLLALAVVGVAATVGGLALAPPLARAVALLPASLAALCGVAMVRRRERTTAGEVTVALALGSFGLPVAVAVGSSMRLALSATLAWWVCSAALTGAVRGLIGRARADGSPRAAWLAAAGSIAGTMTLMAFASLGWTAPVAVAAVLPPTIVTVALAGRC